MIALSNERPAADAGVADDVRARWELIADIAGGLDPAEAVLAAAVFVDPAAVAQVMPKLRPGAIESSDLIREVIRAGLADIANRLKPNPDLAWMRAAATVGADATAGRVRLERIVIDRVARVLNEDMTRNAIGRLTVN